MRPRTRIAFAAACIGIAALNQPATGTPLPRERHVPPQHQPKPRVVARTASLRPAVPQFSLSARTSYAVPALVAEARKYMGTNPTDRKRLWCATFMNFVLARLGYAGTNSDAAKSFAYYGRRVSEPRVGAIAVLTRGRRGGHVGVVSGIDKNGDPIIISGNHNKIVGEGIYPRSRVIAYVMPTEHGARTRIAATGPVSLPASDAGLDSPITELIAAIEAEQAHAEKPVERRQARAPASARERPAPPVPHRTVQQMPEAPRQTTGSARAVGSNPFSALIAEIDRGKARSGRGIR
jgi:uncharacterized protein (TIGR02594 family)